MDKNWSACSLHGDHHLWPLFSSCPCQGLPNKTRWQDLYKSTRRELNAERPASGDTSWTLEGIARDVVGQLLVPSPSQQLAAMALSVG